MLKKLAKYYAVRMGDCVEIRASLNPPRPITSKISKSGLVLSQTFYDGGKVLGWLKYYHFYTKARDFGNYPLPKDGMIVIPKTLRMALRNKMVTP